MKSSSRTRCFNFVAALTLVLAAFCAAQEVGSIDTTGTSQGTELRRSALKSGESVMGHSGVSETYECRPYGKVMGALKTTLISLDRSAYRVGDSPRFQAKVENVGSEPIRLPISPTIVGLQPADAAHKFTYFKMVLQLWIGGRHWESNTGGMVTLYGDDAHTGTMLTLQPGQWVTIIGKGNIGLPQDFKTLTASGDTVSRTMARTFLYQNETLRTGSSVATVSKGVCLKETQAPSLPLHVIEE